jgi:hypothetical protein
MKTIHIFALSVFLVSNSVNLACAEGSAKTPSAYYEIKRFHVFPLTKVLVGQATTEIEKSMGKPTKKFIQQFKEPNRVKLSTLPEFDEQWGYFEGMATNWIFFRNGKVIAAFREESDF